MNDPQDPSSGPAVDEMVKETDGIERGFHGCLVANVQNDLVERSQVRPLLRGYAAAAGNGDSRAHVVGGLSHPEADRPFTSDNDDALAGEVE